MKETEPQLDQNIYCGLFPALSFRPRAAIDKLDM